MKKNGFILSTYVYILLVFFLLLLVTMLAVLNNTKLLSNKLKDQSQNSSGLLDKDFSFVLLGDKDIILRKGEEYEEPTYIAKTSKGKDIKDNVKVIGNVDTSNPNKYTLTYKLTYNGVTKELKRNIHVLDNNAASYIKGLYDYRRDENSLIKDNTEDENIRYAGSNPNNYVYFNCEDTNTAGVVYGADTYDYVSSCEVWRIIGLFDVESEIGGTPEKRIKLVREELSTKSVWDSNAVNQWGETTYTDGTVYEGASLMRYLNTDTSGYYNNLGNVTKGQIEDAYWNTGAVGSPILPIEAYQQERGTNPGSICNGGGSECTNNINRIVEWVGKIGLIYPSDFAYAGRECTSMQESSCGNNNWLKPSDGYYWTISPLAEVSYYFVSRLISSEGTLASNAVSLNAYGVRPSLYLSSSVIITDGDGTIDNPYKLSL